MRHENDGITMWFGTADAPAPSEIVSEGESVFVTLGIEPQDASHAVKVVYRLNSNPGKPQEASAQWIHSDASGKAQYFRAAFPKFSAGDRVEYTAICTCLKKQV